jgi:tRNA pseudouridine38-40 synthase
MQAAPAADDFHARFSARTKTYVYRVLNAPVMSPFWRRYAYHESRLLDIDRMIRTARHFLGEHDWSAFCSAQSDGDSRVRDITAFDINAGWDPRARASIIEFRISANGFLRYMVRSIVGTVMDVGRGDKEIDAVQLAIATGDRGLAGRTAAAHGLTLESVCYDQ